jgi:NifU-like protein
VGLSELLKPFPWALYSQKLASRIERPRWRGSFAPSDTEGRAIRLVKGFAGDVELGNAVQLYWLVDLLDGVIADAAFQAFGQSALIGAADAACELSRGKTHLQAGRIGADLLDRHLRDKSGEPAFPYETGMHLNLVVTALEHAAEQCRDIRVAEPFTPTPEATWEEGAGYPGFDELTKDAQLSLIRHIVAEEIQPFIELDAGGIEVIDLTGGRELLIAYQGACTTCHSATGMTLAYIQQLLRAKVHPELVVTPDLSSLQEQI